MVIWRLQVLNLPAAGNRILLEAIPSLHPSTHSSIHPSIYPPIHPLIPSQRFTVFTQHVNLSVFYLFTLFWFISSSYITLLSIHPSIHPSIPCQGFSVFTHSFNLTVFNLFTFSAFIRHLHNACLSIQPAIHPSIHPASQRSICLSFSSDRENRIFSRKQLCIPPFPSILLPFTCSSISARLQK